MSVRTVKCWVADFEANGEAGLVDTPRVGNVLDRCDPRWVETAVEVMVEHVDQARPMQKTVIERTGARLITASARARCRRHPRRGLVAASQLPGHVAGYAHAAGAEVGDEAGGERIRLCLRHRDQLPDPLGGE